MALSKRAALQQSTGLWWWSPSWTLMGLWLILGAAGLLIPAQQYLEQWRTPKYFDGSSIALLLACLIAFLVGAFCAGSLRRAPGRSFLATDTTLLILKRALDACFALTLAGYAAFLVVALSRGLGPAEVLRVLEFQPGAVYELKDRYFQTVPGITTLTQFGVPATVLGILLWRGFGWTRARWQVLIVVLLAALRAYALSERLALLELAIPGALLYSRFSWVDARRIGGMRKLAINLAPILALFLLALGFTFFEIPRAWASWYAGRGESLAAFGLQRLIGYYATSMNNGALLLQSSSAHPPIPYYTFDWFWNFPGLRQLFSYDALTGGSFDRLYHELLSARANEEFNTPGGIFLPLLDYGVVLGIAAWALLGAVAGRLYASFRAGSLIGLLVYPIFFTGIVESPRILYWFGGRTFPAWVAVAIVLWRVAETAHARWQDAPSLRAAEETRA